MTAQPHSVNPSQTLEFAYELMKKYGCRHLPVLAGKKIVGTISDRDFSLVGLYPDMNLKTSKVEEIMVQDPYLATTETSLQSVVVEMAENKIGSAIITDQAGDLVGIFTAVDALRLIAKIYDSK